MHGALEYTKRQLQQEFLLCSSWDPLRTKIPMLQFNHQLARYTLLFLKFWSKKDIIFNYKESIIRIEVRRWPDAPGNEITATMNAAIGLTGPLPITYLIQEK